MCLQSNFSSLQEKVYFTGGYSDVVPQPPGLPRIIRRPHLLHDITCLDLTTGSWVHESPFPAPPAFLDGHTATIVGSRLYLIAGGTYPESRAPDGPFSLDVSHHVHVLEMNPPCNSDGSIPALAWRSLRLVEETQEDIYDLLGQLHEPEDDQIDDFADEDYVEEEIDAENEAEEAVEEDDEGLTEMISDDSQDDEAPVEDGLTKSDDPPETGLHENVDAAPQTQPLGLEEEEWEELEDDDHEPMLPPPPQIGFPGALHRQLLQTPEAIRDFFAQRLGGNPFAAGAGLNNHPWFPAGLALPGQQPRPPRPADGAEGAVGGGDGDDGNGRVAAMYQRLVHVAGNIRRFMQVPEDGAEGHPDQNEGLAPLGIQQPPAVALAVARAPQGPRLRPRVWHSATVVGTRIYIIGGRDIRLRYFGDVTYFDTVTETFHRVQFPEGARTLPPRAAHGAVCPDGRHIYVFGGRYKHPNPAMNRGLTHRHYNDLWVFDTRNENWKRLINPPEGDPEKYLKVPVNPAEALAVDEEVDENVESDDDLDDTFAEYEYDLSGKKRRKRASTNQSTYGTEKKPKTAEKSFADYPAPRCCFVMVLDPDLPHKAHIIGGYTSSNICFYYISDAWTLDLLELSWTRVPFKAGCRLSRVSIHTPTCYYNDVILFSGEGSQDRPELAYDNQLFLNETTIFTPPSTPLADILRYRDPVAHKYFKMLRRRDLSDVTLESPKGTWHLHRVVVAARMKPLLGLLNTANEFARSQAEQALQASLSSSAPDTQDISGSPSAASISAATSASKPSVTPTGLRSSFKSASGGFSLRMTQSAFNVPGVIIGSAPVSAEIWSQWLVSSMPPKFFSTFNADGLLSTAADVSSKAMDTEHSDSAHSSSSPSSMAGIENEDSHTVDTSPEKVAAEFFDLEALETAFLFTYTDAIRLIHQIPLRLLVQLYHLGFVLGIHRLSAVVLLQIGERLDPYFPLYSNRALIAQMILTTRHFQPDADQLINALLWHHRNANYSTKFKIAMNRTNVSDPIAVVARPPVDIEDLLADLREQESNEEKPASTSAVMELTSIAERITPDLTLPLPKNLSIIAPIGDISAVANSWLALGGAFAPLPTAMENSYLTLQNDETSRDSAPNSRLSPGEADGAFEDADFALFLPEASDEAPLDASAAPSTEDVSSSGMRGMSSSVAPAQSGEMGVSSFFPSAPVHPASVPIGVHKSILIFSSPYLRGLLSENFQEAQQGFALLENLPYPMERSSLGALMQFMYSGSFKHITDKNAALDILCNVPFFFTQLPELTKPLPHLGVSSTRMLRPRCIELELMSHCMDVVLSGDVDDDEFKGLMELAKALALVQFDQRINIELQKRLKKEAA